MCGLNQSLNKSKNKIKIACNRNFLVVLKLDGANKTKIPFFIQIYSFWHRPKVSPYNFTIVFLRKFYTESRLILIVLSD